MTEPSTASNSRAKSAYQDDLRSAQDALVAEFHTLVGDTEKLLKHTADIAGLETEELRARIDANLSRAREMLKDSEVSLREQGQAAVQTTETYVHAHPWQTIGIAAGVGFLLGLLARR